MWTVWPIAGSTRGFPATYTGVRDLLYLNDGRGDGGRVTFREVGMEAGLEIANFEYGLGALFSDPDGDGDLDLYVANDTNPDRLYDNVPWPGGAEADPAGLGFRFEELASRAGVADPGAQAVTDRFLVRRTVAAPGPARSFRRR